MNILEFESKVSRHGALLKLGKKVENLFCVWYGTREDPTILLNTISSDKENSLKKLKKIYSEVEFEDGTQIGIASVKRHDDTICLMGAKTIGEEKKKDSFEVHIPLNKLAENDAKNDLKETNSLSVLDLEEFVVIDTETTGIGKTDEVVELAAVRVKRFKIIDRFHSYIIPTKAIRLEAQRVHGLSKEFLNENGKDAADVYREFKQFVGSLPVAGHNVKFDINKIKYHSGKNKIKIDLFAGFDTLTLSRKVMQRSNHKLANIVDDYDLRQGLKSHNAMDDVLGTLRYASILERIYRRSCSISL